MDLRCHHHHFLRLPANKLMNETNKKLVFTRKKNTRSGKEGESDKKKPHLQKCNLLFV